MGMISNIREAMQARSEAKRIQSQIDRLQAEYSNGGITCVVNGDMTIASITVAPEAYDEVKAGKPERFETMMRNVINGALKRIREKIQSAMMSELKDSGMLKGLMGR